MPARCTFELRPEHAVSIIRAQKAVHPRTFLSPEQLERLKRIAQKITPPHQQQEDYDAQIEQAFAEIEQLLNKSN